MTILVMGWSGFIGSVLVRHLVHELGEPVANVDRLTYAGNVGAAIPLNLYHFERVDVCDGPELGRVLKVYSPRTIVYLAAETHVDRSIDSPDEFIRTNIFGTFTLLEATREYLQSSPQRDFRFIHVSTDEVFGALDREDSFAPSSPFSILNLQSIR